MERKQSAARLERRRRKGEGYRKEGGGCLIAFVEEQPTAIDLKLFSVKKRKRAKMKKGPNMDLH